MLLLTAVTFSLIGFIIGIWADGFEKLQLVPLLIVTPLAVLGGTRGTLVVDAYTGYNRVVDVDGRTRSSCLAHVRRKFFEALTSHPEAARRALDLTASC